MNKHFIIKGDALKLIPKIKKKVDAVIVDPPYNTANKNTKVLKGRKARSSDFGSWDYFTEKGYLDFTENWLGLIKPILKENGNILIFSNRLSGDTSIQDLFTQGRFISSNQVQFYYSFFLD